jgi:histidyl-tRNA synthetase
MQAEFFYKVKPKLPQQFAGAEKNGVPYAVVLGEDELVAGMVKIKEMGLPEGHPEKNGVDVKLDELVQEVKKRLIARGLKEEELVRAVQAVQLGERKKVAFE